MNASENGVTFALEGEDHTLANALRFMLNKK
jgi:DNA-directed RNA polymerase subunit L